MTTTRMQRCAHCNEVYAYHPSFYGMMPRYNDDRYCPACAEVIEKALEDVPVKVKFERRFVETKDYTKEQIVSAQEERCKQPGLNARRIMPGLFDMKDPSNEQRCVLERMPDPVTKIMHYYSATWWSKEENSLKIKKEVWWDIKNKVIAQDQREY
jgi:copper chaperone CopZ